MDKKLVFLSITIIYLTAFEAQAGILPENAFSNEARGTTCASFLKNPPFARFQALGQGGIALSGIDSMFYNPAGLNLRGQNGSSVSMGYETLLESSYRASLAYLKSSGSKTIGLGFLYFSSTDFGEFNSLGDYLGKFSTYDMAIIGSYSKRFNLTDFGMSAKIITSKLYDKSANSVAMDVGLIFRDKPGSGRSGTDVALSVRNLGIPMKLGSKTSPLPLELAGGIGWHYTRYCDIILEGKLPVDNSPYLLFAVEQFISFEPLQNKSGLVLRIGYNFKNHEELEFMGAFTGGFGVKISPINIDYAFVPYGDLGNTHRVTFSYAFNMGSSDLHEGIKMHAEKEMDTKTSILGKSIAVTTFLAKNVKDSESFMASNFVESELIKTGKYKVVDRTNIGFILAEQKLDISGMPDVNYGFKVGALMQVDFVVVGSLSKIEDEFYVTAKVIDVSSVEVVKIVTEKTNALYKLKETCRNLVQKLAE